MDSLDTSADTYASVADRLADLVQGQPRGSAIRNVVVVCVQATAIRVEVNRAITRDADALRRRGEPPYHVISSDRTLQFTHNVRLAAALDYYWAACGPDTGEPTLIEALLAIAALEVGDRAVHDNHAKDDPETWRICVPVLQALCVPAREITRAVVVMRVLLAELGSTDASLLDERTHRRVERTREARRARGNAIRVVDGRYPTLDVLAKRFDELFVVSGDGSAEERLVDRLVEHEHGAICRQRRRVRALSIAASPQ